MNVVVIVQSDTRQLIAVVENPDNAMSKGAVALAWAKSEGYERFPLDCTCHESKLVSYGTVQRKLTPVHELEALEEAGKHII